MAESNAVIHIVNSALYRLGEKPISSLEQGTETANVCQELYPDVRDTLLSWQAWPFATVRQALVRLSSKPPSDYKYYYGLPTELSIIRVVDIDLQQRSIEYQREIYVNPGDPTDQRNVIATDAETVVMRYIGRTSEGVWPGLFVATMAVYLAATIAPSISRKASLRDTLLIELYGAKGTTGLLDKLRDIVGYEDSPREMPMPTSYLDIRAASAGGASHIYTW